MIFVWEKIRQVLAVLEELVLGCLFQVMLIGFFLLVVVVVVEAFFHLADPQATQAQKNNNRGFAVVVVLSIDLD